MKKLVLLLGVFLVFSCGTSKPAVEPINTNEQSVNTFRGYDWGTPKSVVIAKEGKPDSEYNGHNIFSTIFRYPDYDTFSSDYTTLRFVDFMPKQDELSYKGIKDPYILKNKEYLKSKGLWGDRKEIQVAGYNVGDMGFYFFQNKLIAGDYFIYEKSYNDKSIKEIHADLLRKMTVLYGEPETFTWGSDDTNFHHSVWKNIDLQLTDGIIEGGSISIKYSSYDYFIEQYKQMIVDHQNDTTGL